MTAEESAAVARVRWASRRRGERARVMAIERGGWKTRRAGA